MIEKKEADVIRDFEKFLKDQLVNDKDALNMIIGFCYGLAAAAEAGRIEEPGRGRVEVPKGGSGA